MTIRPHLQSRLGRLLFYLRRQAYLSREQLAERSGISVDSLQSLEQGRSCNPKAKTLLGLARALNVPVAKLLDCIAEDLQAEGSQVRRSRRKASAHFSQ